MKKKLLAALSLTLACGFAFSTVACSKDKTEKDPPKRDPLDFSTATTNDEIYESLKAGLAASMAHKDGITMTTTANIETKEGDTVKSTQSTSGKTSFDPASAVYYSTSTRTRKQDTQETTSVSTSKYFKESDKYYGYSSEEYANQPARTGYSECAPDFAAEFAEDAKYYMESYTNRFNVLLAAESFDDMQAAYDKVYGDSLTEEKKTNADATASASFAVANNEGTLTATLTCAVASKYVNDQGTEDTADDVTVTYSETATGVLTAKDGKIVAFKQTSTETEKKGDVTETYTSVNDMALTYEFDKTGYDAITVSLPTDNTLKKYAPSYDINFVYNGMAFTSSDYSEDYAQEKGEATVEKVIEKWTNDATQTIANYEGKTFGGAGATARAITLYTDAACTKALSSSATLEELEEMEAVYVKTITPAEGTALIGHMDYGSYSYKYDLSKEYQIVYAFAMAETEETNDYEYGYFDFKDLAQDDQKTFAFKPVEEGQTVNAYVNGTKTTEESITLESGKVYMVSYERIYKDADMGVFWNY